LHLREIKGSVSSRLAGRTGTIGHSPQLLRIALPDGLQLLLQSINLGLDLLIRVVDSLRRKDVARALVVLEERSDVLKVRAEVGRGPQEGRRGGRFEVGCILGQLSKGLLDVGEGLDTKGRLTSERSSVVRRGEGRTDLEDIQELCDLAVPSVDSRDESLEIGQT
jgi:hypothetical protein